MTETALAGLQRNAEPERLSWDSRIEDGNNLIAKDQERKKQSYRKLIKQKIRIRGSFP